MSARSHRSWDLQAFQEDDRGDGLDTMRPSREVHADVGQRTEKARVVGHEERRR